MTARTAAFRHQTTAGPLPPQRLAGTGRPASRAPARDRPHRRGGSTAAARRLNFGALHQIIQSWMLTFPDMATLDAQFDEAKIAMGEIRSIKELTKSDWSDYWGAVQLVSNRSGGEYKLPGRPWHFSRDELTPIGTPAFQGEHNREVFAELGVSEPELQRLSEAGVLVTHRRVPVPEVAAEPRESAGQAA